MKHKGPDEHEILPVTLKINQIYPNGMMEIFFSERLKSLAELQFTYKRELSEDILEIVYINNQEGNCVPQTPKLDEWFITKFDSDKLEIFLNITNQEYVSSSDLQDELRIRVKNPYLFQSAKTNVTAKMNYTLTYFMPAMVKASDAEYIMSMGDSAKNSMMISLVIPFAFMVFMSCSMDRVWSMYLML